MNWACGGGEAILNLAAIKVIVCYNVLDYYMP